MVVVVLVIVVVVVGGREGSLKKGRQNISQSQQLVVGKLGPGQSGPRQLGPGQLGPEPIGICHEIFDDLRIFL